MTAAAVPACATRVASQFAELRRFHERQRRRFARCHRGAAVGLYRIRKDGDRVGERDDSGRYRAGGSHLHSDPLANARNILTAETGISVFDSNPPVVERSDVLILAVKPRAFRQVLDELRPLVTAEHLVVSIAAGITIASIVEGLGTKVRVIRVMSNTPALVGKGPSAFALGPRAHSEDEAVVRTFLGSVGHAVCVAESLLDAVTGLSGSGPAFVYLMIEALSDGGVRVGLPRDVATLLAAQTLFGLATMVLEGPRSAPRRAQGSGCLTGWHDDRRAACIERAGVRGRLIDAVEAATRRSAELSALTAPPTNSTTSEAPR